MNKKGFTLVEVIVSFVLVTAVSIALFRATVSIQQRQKANIALNSFKAFNLAINNEIQYDFLTDKILSTNACGTNCYDIQYESRGTIRITLDKENGIISYGPFKEKLPDDYTFYDNMTITNYSSASEGLNSYVALTIPVKSNYDPSLTSIKYMYEYDSAKSDEIDLNLPDMCVTFANKVGSGGLFRDDHGDLRYKGSNPDNYVTFNNEIWRIVGIFNCRVKLVRKDSIGTFSWDTLPASDTHGNSGYGINQWGASGAYAGSDLMRELNGDYLNSSLNSNTNWYNNADNGIGNGNFNKNYVLKANAQELIGNAIWYTGGVPYNNPVTLAEAYVAERGTQGKMCSSGSHCSDEVERTYTWAGQVGLIYPSDFAYASANNNCSTDITWNNTYCDNNWMSNYGWTISPAPDSSHANRVWLTTANNASNNSAHGAIDVHPVVYLKSNVKVAGEGTISNPYVFTIGNQAVPNYNLNSIYTRIQNLDTNITNIENSTTEVQTILSNLTDNTNSNNIFLKIYPIGSIYTSTTDTNPGTIFGGTWVAFGSGRTLVGVDTSQTEFNTVEKTGGEKTHTLTIAEMASHTHTRGTMDIIGEFRAYSSYNLNNTSFASKLKGPFWYNTNESDNYGTSKDLADGSSDAVRQIHFQASRAWTGETSSVGDGSAHNNLQPYITVYMWKRTN